MRKLKRLPLEVLGLASTIAIRTQYEVAALLGCSRANVQQLEQSALHKLYKGLVKVEGGSQSVNTYPRRT